MKLPFGLSSLRSVLSLYFLPLSVVPAILISLYSIKLFEENAKENLAREARAEKEAFLLAIQNWEEGILEQTQALAREEDFASAFVLKPESAIKRFPKSSGLTSRLYSPAGKFLASTDPKDGTDRIAVLPQQARQRLYQGGSTVERFFFEEPGGFLTIARALVRKGGRVVGIVEQRQTFGRVQLLALKAKRSADLVLFKKDLSVAVGSFALSTESLQSISSIQSPSVVHEGSTTLALGKERFEAFFFDFPATGLGGESGYLGLFLSLTGVDAAVGKLKAAMITVAVFLILLASLLILIFSRRLVRPIEALVLAMKRVRTGKIQQIPEIESAEEIDYLVRSFNEMASNISLAKNALEEKVGELHEKHDQLQETQRYLVRSEKLVSLGQLVAGVAHELNNPIGFIYSNMQHLSQYSEKIQQAIEAYKKLHGQLSAKDRQQIETLLNELEIDFILKDITQLAKSCADGARRTRDIVMGLRTFSRMDESRMEEADLKEAIQNTLTLLSSELKNRIHVHETYEEIPKIECNLSQMNQVFMNLLTNAAQAIEGKGDIWIRTFLEGEDVIVEIEDNGQGILPEALDKIFDPFFTTKKIGEGTGLGLSITYGLIERHHGEIKVESEPGRGTLFRVILPVYQPHSAKRIQRD